MRATVMGVGLLGCVIACGASSDDAGPTRPSEGTGAKTPFTVASTVVLAETELEGGEITRVIASSKPDLCARLATGWTLEADERALTLVLPRAEPRGVQQVKEKT